MNEKFGGIKAALFDLDGTVYIGGKLIPGAKEAINALRRGGIKIVYLTNNSSADAEEYACKLTRLGVLDAADEVCSSLTVGAKYLKEHNCGRVYAVASERVKGYLEKQGIALAEGGGGADTVFLTYDKELNYDKLVTANRLLYAGANYVATHADKVCPAEGAPLPDAGSFIALFKESSGRLPDVIIGKPYPYMAEYLSEKLNLALSEMLMVGDRLYTDVAFGVNSGLKTALVLSGETTEKTYALSDIKADIVINSIADLPEYF